MNKNSTAKLLLFYLLLFLLATLIRILTIPPNPIWKIMKTRLFLKEFSENQRRRRNPPAAPALRKTLQAWKPKPFFKPPLPTLDEKHGETLKYFLPFENSLEGLGLSFQDKNGFIEGAFVPGIIGTALQFEGHLSFLASPAVRFANGYSIEFWFKVNAFGEKRHSSLNVVDIDGSAMFTGIISESKKKRDTCPYWFINFPRGHAMEHLVEINRLATGIWYHFALVVDTKKDYQAYVNGIPIFDETVSIPVQGKRPQVFLDSFSKVQFIGSPGYRRTIDHFCVYHYPRTPEQIASEVLPRLRAEKEIQPPTAGSPVPLFKGWQAESF